MTTPRSCSSRSRKLDNWRSTDDVRLFFQVFKLTKDIPVDDLPADLTRDPADRAAGLVYAFVAGDFCALIADNQMMRTGRGPTAKN